MSKVICPKCGKSLKTLDTSVDVKARCPACKHIFMYKPRGSATPAPKEPAIKKPTLLIAGVGGLGFLAHRGLACGHLAEHERRAIGIVSSCRRYPPSP